ncbi:hypothetical protein R6Q59_031348 [Mikania micrantha]
MRPFGLRPFGRPWFSFGRSRLCPNLPPFQGSFVVSKVKIVSYKGWKSKTAVKKAMNSNIPADQPLLSTIPASILRVRSDPLYS